MKKDEKKMKKNEKTEKKKRKEKGKKREYKTKQEKRERKGKEKKRKEKKRTCLSASAAHLPGQLRSDAQSVANLGFSASVFSEDFSN